MSDQWFIFKKGQHSGPFVFDDLLNRLESKQISLDTMVWKRGDKGGWKTIKETPEFQEVEARKASPPPIPTKEKTDDNVIPFQKKVKKDSLVQLEEESQEKQQAIEISKDSVEDDLLEEVEAFKSQVRDLAAEPEYETENEIEPLEKKRSKVGIIFLLMFVLCVGGLVAGFLISQNISLSDLYKNDADHLSHIGIWKRPLTSSVDINLEYTDKRKMLGFLNRLGPGTIVAKIQSISGMTISKEPILLESKSNFLKGTFVLDHFLFEKGESIKDGYYWITIQGEDDSFITKTMEILKKIPLVNTATFIKTYDDKFSYKGRFLLGNANKENFEKELLSFKNKWMDSIIQPLEEIIQRYQTCIGLLHSLSGEIKTSRSSNLEKIYIKKFSPIFEGVMIDSHKLQVSTYSDNPLKSKENGDFVEFGKDVGDLVVKTSRLLKRSSNRRQSIDYYEKNMKTLVRQAQARIFDLQEKIRLNRDKILGI